MDITKEREEGATGEEIEEGDEEGKEKGEKMKVVQRKMLMESKKKVKKRGVEWSRKKEGYWERIIEQTRWHRR